MYEKKINQNGQKDRQKNELCYACGEQPDRSWQYRDWLRTVQANGIFYDLDMVKWRNTPEGMVPVAITEITRCDYDSVTQNYLNSIVTRYNGFNGQGEMVKTMMRILKVPGYIILFQKDLAKLWVYSFQHAAWRTFTKEGWLSHLKTL